MPITRQQVSDWKQSEVTRAYFEGIGQKIEELAGILAAGASLGDNVAQTTARYVGRIEGLSDALDVDIATVIEGDQMAIEIVGHRVLIDPDPVETKTQSGIVLVKDEARYREATMSGTVVQIGSTAWQGFGDNQPWCKVGDKIIYAKYTGKFVTDPETEKEYYVINDEDVQVKITNKGKEQL